MQEFDIMPNAEFLAAFEADPGDPVEIARSLVSAGRAGTCPPWYADFAQRKAVANALNCPVWCVSKTFEYEQPLVFLATLNIERQRLWFEIGDMAARVEVHTRELAAQYAEFAHSKLHRDINGDPL